MSRNLKGVWILVFFFFVGDISIYMFEIKKKVKIVCIFKIFLEIK